MLLFPSLFVRAATPVAAKSWRFGVPSRHLRAALPAPHRTAREHRQAKERQHGIREPRPRPGNKGAQPADAVNLGRVSVRALRRWRRREIILRDDKRRVCNAERADRPPPERRAGCGERTQFVLTGDQLLRDESAIAASAVSEPMRAKR